MDLFPIFLAKPKSPSFSVLPFFITLAGFRSLRKHSHIPMDDSFLDQRQKSITNLPQQLDCQFFRMLDSRLDVGGQVSIAQLLYNIVIFAALHHVIEAYDVI